MLVSAARRMGHAAPVAVRMQTRRAVETRYEISHEMAGGSAVRINSAGCSRTGPILVAQRPPTQS